MRAIAVVVFSLPFCFSIDGAAFVSTLSSESFVLAAKVLAYQLRNLHPHTPFVVLATEDISTSSFDSLRAHSVDVRRVEKIDTPYIEDHAAIKYQYTKIRLWSLMTFSSIVHLDLDVLPLRSIDSLFRCGVFCASFRHSDMFNSGVFVLKPDMQVYSEMLAKSSLQNFSSYDGGDQGFLNSFFNSLKYSPMFDENSTQPVCSSPMHTLSAAFNYDVAMFYVTGRQLVSPVILHYTMGPTKPWIWWTYPLLDLNSHWLTARLAMEETYGEGESASEQVLGRLALMTALYGLFYQFMQLYTGWASARLAGSLSLLRVSCPSSLRRLQSPLAAAVSVSLSLLISFHSIPQQTLPTAAWILFISQFLLSVVFFCSSYSSAFFSQSFSALLSFRFCCLSLCVVLFDGVFLLLLSSFLSRIFFLLFSVPSTLAIITFLASRILIHDDSAMRKYELLHDKI